MTYKVEYRGGITEKRNPQDSATPRIDDASATRVTDIPNEIEKYHALKEQGIITEEEFTAKKNQLLEI